MGSESTRGEALETDAAIEIPGYILGARIGAGGFGEVFAARHVVLGRDVAIKILHAKYATDTTAVARFVAEARSVNQISHPGIVQIFDFGTIANGRQYCVMERLHGETLRDVLRARGRLPLAEAVPILRAIGAAVDAAHAAGIAHRDLKPDNVFVLADGQVKLIDFGLAKLLRDDPAATPVTRTGAVFGTPLYMSPEQCRGTAVGLRTDCYSFGMLAYHVLTGALPWTGDALELALHHLHDDPEPPSRRCAELDARVDRGVLALLAKDPRDRPTPLVAAVDALTGKPLPATRRGWLIAAIVIAAISVGSAIALRVNRGASPERTATTGWAVRQVPWPDDDLPLAATVTPSADEVIYVLPGSAWRVRLGETTARPFALEDPGSVRHLRSTRDGSLVVSREQDRDAWIWHEDPVRGRRERVTTGTLGLPAGDDGIAFVRDGTVYERTLHAPRETLIASVAGTIVALDRSPDGVWFAWTRAVPGDTFQTEILNTRTKSIRVVNSVTAHRAVAFVGDRALAYCDENRRVRVRDLDTDRDDVLLQLAPSATTCSIGTSTTGDRMVVGTSLMRLTTAVMSLREPARGWRRVAAGIAEEFTADGRVVATPWNGSPGTGPRGAIGALGREGELSNATPYSLDGVAGAPLGTCAGAVHVVRRRDELLYNVNVPARGSLAMQLVRPGDCSIAAAWTIPDLPNWTFPRCGGELCVTARVEGGAVWIWALRSGETSARELTRIPISVAIMSPTVEVSADGRLIALTVPQAHDEIYLIDSTTGTTRTQHAGAWPGTSNTEERAEWATWAADGLAIYVSGVRTSGSHITRVSLDGDVREMWSRESEFVSDARTSPDGQWLAGTRAEIVLDVHVLDR